MISRIKWLILVVVLQTSVASAAEPQPPYILGVHPYLPAKEVHARFSPLAAYLAKTLNHPVEVRVGRDYDEHIAAIGNDRLDIAFMGPAQYVTLVEKYGPKPLLARLEIKGKPHLIGVIFTRQDNALRSLAELKGKTFAYGDPQSTMSHLVPMHMLERAGVPETALGRYQFLGAHKNVVLSVLAGDFDAGSVKSEVYDEYAGKGLRVLATSAPVTEHALVTRRTLPPEQVERLRQALLTIRSSPGGLEIAKSINRSATNLVPVTDRDFDGLRQIMNIKRK